MSSTQALESVITKAVVFQDRAQVFRTGKVLLPAGEHTLHFSGLWQAVDRDSLQLAVEPQKDNSHRRATLLSVQFRTVHQSEDIEPLREAALSAVSAAQKAVRNDEDQIDTHNVAIASYKSVLAKMTSPTTTVLQPVTSGSGAPFCQEQQPPLRYDCEKQRVMAAFCRDGQREHTTKKRIVEKSLVKSKEVLQKAERELGALQGIRSKVRRTAKEVAEVKLQIAQEVSLSLVLSYLVKNASWEAVYDLRVSHEKKSMQVTYAAMVKQATGEDWGDVQLELSTAKPQTAAAPPGFTPWTLSFPRPPPMLHSRAMKKHKSGGFSLSRSCEAPAPVMERQMFQTNMMPTEEACVMDCDELDGEMPGASAPRVAEAAVSEGTTAMSFGVALPVSLKADNNPTRVAITILDLPIHFRYSCVPKLDPLVYLKVKAKNTSPYQLLPGKASVFAGPQLLTTTHMDHVFPEEDFWTFLGTDGDIRCERRGTSVKESDISAWIGTGSKKKDISFTFVCSSSKAPGSGAVELVVWDQYPVSDAKAATVSHSTPSPDDKISVGREGPASAAKGAGASGEAEGERRKKQKAVEVTFKTNEVEFIEWFVDLAPQREVEWDFGYAIEHPQDKGLTNFDGRV